MNVVEYTSTALKLEGSSRKFLTFELNGEEYGLDILKVQEIIGMLSITHVPKMPGYVKGIINLRGRIIPVVDLRLKFDMSPQDYDDRTCIVEVRISVNEHELIMGMIVDRVSEVLDIPLEQIEDSPEYIAGIGSEFIVGMGKVGQRVIMLLDIDKLFSDKDVDFFRNAVH